MRKLVGFIVTLCTFWSSLSFSDTATAWNENAIAVTPNSEMQKQIDEVTTEIFNSPIGLCTIFKNATSIYHSLGVSPQTAINLAKNCKQENDEPAKALMKHYYISFAQNTGLDSWTDLGNNTYIFVDNGLSRQRLKSILLHEIAIATDAKSKMLLPTYTALLAMYKLSKSNPKHITEVTIDIDTSTDYQKALQQAFNFSAWEPLNKAFATVRAFSLEAQSEGRPHIILNQDQCATTVRSLLKVMKSLPTPPRAQGSDESVTRLLGLVEDLNSKISKNYEPKSPEHEEAILNFVLSPKLTLKDLDGSVRTFCDFMTQPLLINRSMYSMYASGPRPRLTGGSGGQGLSNGDVASRGTLQTPEDRQLQQVLEKMKIENPNTMSRKDLTERPASPDSREELLKRAIAQPK